MKVLYKEEKNIYESLDIKFNSIDCWDIDIPEGWKKIIINDETFRK